MDNLEEELKAAEKKNRAKRFCLKASFSDLYKNIREYGPDNGFTDVMTEQFKNEIDAAKKIILQNNKTKYGHKSARKGHSIEKILDLNMGQYMYALNMHSQKILPEWHKSLTKKDKEMFVYRK